MNTDRHLHRTLSLMVKNFPGSYTRMAELVGVTQEMLEQRLGKNPRFPCDISLAKRISDACIEHDTPFCRAYATALAGESSQAAATTPQTLQADAVSLVKEASDALGVFNEALSDGHISDNDFDRCDRELIELEEAVQKARRDLKAAHQGGKLRSVA